MCNRVRRTSRKKLQELFGDVLVTETERPPEELTTGFDRPMMPVLTSYPEVALEEMEWGFLPREAGGNPGLQGKLGILLNARAETVLEKFAFRNAIRQHRCIIPIEGFYEHMHSMEGKKKVKTPYYISLDTGLMFVAGVWDVCDGRKTFAMITTAANPLMANIHNTKERQPHLLDQDEWAQWLDPALSDTELKAMLSNIYPDSHMQAALYEVPGVGKKEKVQKVKEERPPAAPQQPTLF